MKRHASLILVIALTVGTVAAVEIGREVAVSRHLQDGDEYHLPPRALIEHGRKLLTANWTIQEGGGRPLTKGTGAPLSDMNDPLVFPRNFNRVSTPDANSCAGCHSQPFGLPGGHGDIVANVFVLGQRFDFLTFDRINLLPTKSSADELGRPVTLQSAADSRVTIGMFFLRDGAARKPAAAGRKSPANRRREIINGSFPRLEAESAAQRDPAP